MNKYGWALLVCGQPLGCPYIHCNPPFVHSSRISTAFKSAASSQRCRAGGRATPGRSKHHHHRHRCSRPPAPLPGGGNSLPTGMSKHPQPRPGAPPPPRPGHLSDALGTLRPVTWGTLRVIRATRPLRYAAPFFVAACPYLPATPAQNRTAQGRAEGHCARN